MPDVTDNFNRANETPMAGNWTGCTAVAGGETEQLKLASNAVTFTTQNVDEASFYSGAGWDSDQGSEVALSMTGGTSASSEGPGVCLRRVSAGTKTMYRVAVNKAASNNIDIAKFAANTYTSLKQITSAWTSGDVLGVTVEGPANNAVIKVYRNGVFLDTVTDTSATVPASGSPGISVSGGTAVTAVTLDNWHGFSPVSPTIFVPNYSIFPTGTAGLVPNFPKPPIAR